MQITNQLVTRQMNDSQTKVAAGDIGPVFIKERVSGNQATVLFKAQEFSAKFEGAVPSSDRMLAEVVGMPEKGKLILKEYAQSAGAKSETQSIDSRLVKAGFDPADQPALKDALKIFDGKGLSLSKEDLTTLNKFINENPGTIPEKLEAVKVLAQKNLPVTTNHLNAIHSALHGPDLKDALRELSGDIKFEAPQPRSNSSNVDVPRGSGRIDIDQILQQVRDGKLSAQDVEALIARLDPKGSAEMQQLKQDIAKALQIYAAGAERIQKSDNPQSIADGKKLQKIAAAKLRESLERLAVQLNKTTEKQNLDDHLRILHSSLKDAQKEPSLTKAIDMVGKALADFAGDQDLTQINNTFEKASQQADQGRELAARRMVADAVNQLEKEHPSLQKSGEPLSLTETEQYAINESLQSLTLQSKTLLVTEISKKLSQLAIDFKKVKQEITKSLDHVALMLDKGGSKVNANQTLDAAINKLDNAILKSNFMLYTDMLTEKKMLNASSRLAEARNLLAKGEISQASQLVKEVKTTLDQIIYKPSNTRVQHFVTEQSQLNSSSTLEDQLAYGIKQAVRPMPDQDYSARQVFETFRRLGLTHENDAANSLVFGSKGDQDELNQNVKARLIQMAAQDAEGQGKAEQALANLTGQQLLNKQDPSGMQNLFMQMPFLLNQKMENIKVFINSQKLGEKIDWENCSLFFVLETKKLGEVGIHVTAQNKNISIAFNSKKDDLDKMLEPMTQLSKERLEEIGYKLEALKAKKTESVLGSTESEEPASVLTPAFTEKGYDFTI
jgi:hypothetical protein